MSSDFESPRIPQLRARIERRTADWKQAGRGLDSAGWPLLAVHSGIGLDRVAAELQRAEARVRRLVMVRTRLLAPAAEELAWFARRAGSSLGAPELERLERLLDDGSRVRRIDELLVSGLEGQRVRVTSRLLSVRVAGYTSQLVQQSRGHMPSVEELRSGSLLQVRAAGGPDETRVELAREFSRIELTPWRIGALRLQRLDRSITDCSISLRVPRGGGYLRDLGAGQYLLIEAWSGR